MISDFLAYIIQHLQPGVGHLVLIIGLESWNCCCLMFSDCNVSWFSSKFAKIENILFHARITQQYNRIIVQEILYISNFVKV